MNNLIDWLDKQISFYESLADDLGNIRDFSSAANSLRTADVYRRVLDKVKRDNWQTQTTPSQEQITQAAKNCMNYLRDVMVNGKVSYCCFDGWSPFEIAIKKAFNEITD